jgi:hypothetical protein
MGDSDTDTLSVPPNSLVEDEEGVPATEKVECLGEDDASEWGRDTEYGSESGERETGFKSPKGVSSERHNPSREMEGYIKGREILP